MRARELCRCRQCSTTPYKNSIALADQPQFPGNLELEQRIRDRALERARHGGARQPRLPRARRAYRDYRLRRDLFEVGFNHFFRSDDLVYFQPLSPRGVRAGVLEAACPKSSFRTTDEKPKARTCSYCHPYLMPGSGVSDARLGLGPLQRDLPGALHAGISSTAGILKTAGRKLWAFVGDGEMDEPESSPGCRSRARRPRQPDLCRQLQPCSAWMARSAANGSIVQELEGPSPAPAGT